MRFVCFGELLLRLAAPRRELLLQSPSLEVCGGGAEARLRRTRAASCAPPS